MIKRIKRAWRARHTVGSVTGETLPPCVHSESSQSWRVKGFEITALLCLCIHPDSDFIHPAPYWIITAHPIFPALLRWWVTLRPQQWLRCESQKVTCPYESHDSLLPVPWNYYWMKQEKNNKEKTMTGICANICLMKSTNDPYISDRDDDGCWITVVAYWIGSFYDTLVLVWHVTLPRS